MHLSFLCLFKSFINIGKEFLLRHQCWVIFLCCKLSDILEQLLHCRFTIKQWTHLAKQLRT